MSTGRCPCRPRAPRYRGSLVPRANPGMPTDIRSRRRHAFSDATFCTDEMTTAASPAGQTVRPEYTGESSLLACRADYEAGLHRVRRRARA
jgi:hypothetical protein